MAEFYSIWGHILLHDTVMTQYSENFFTISSDSLEVRRPLGMLMVLGSIPGRFPKEFFNSWCQI